MPHTASCCARSMSLSETATRLCTDEKTAFYRELCGELERACGIQPTDVVVNFVENTDEDWSFGHGRAQFLTGELQASTPARHDERVS